MYLIIHKSNDKGDGLGKTYWHFRGCVDENAFSGYGVQRSPFFPSLDGMEMRMGARLLVEEIGEEEESRDRNRITGIRLML